MEFAVVEASPQEISGRNPNQPAAVWLVVLLQGEASLSDGVSTVRWSRATSSMARPA